MHFVSISVLAVALATSAMAATPKFDVTPVEARVPGIIKSNDGYTCLDSDGGQNKTEKCGLFVSDGAGGLSSQNGFLAFNGENLTVVSQRPELAWKGVELPSQIGTAVYGLTVYNGDKIIEGPAWTTVLGETISKPREDFAIQHLIFKQSADGTFW